MILCHADGCSSSKGVASHRFPLSPNAKILPARPQHLARCLQQGRKHLQRWAPRWYFNLSGPDEENSPGQSRSLEKKTVFLPEPGPGQHVQHFVKLIVNWAGSGVERSCRWCVFAVSACSVQQRKVWILLCMINLLGLGAFYLRYAPRLVTFGGAVATINDL